MKDTIAVRNLSDSIAINAKRHCKLYQSRFIDKYRYVVTYVEAEKSNNDLNIVFKVKYIGGNLALEITGTPEFQFERATGIFLDLFPFWKK
jgi:hypothetical protein